jgi:hypothetical protein
MMPHAYSLTKSCWRRRVPHKLEGLLSEGHCQGKLLEGLLIRFAALVRICKEIFPMLRRFTLSPKRYRLLSK